MFNRPGTPKGWCSVSFAVDLLLLAVGVEKREIARKSYGANAFARRLTHMRARTHMQFVKNERFTMEDCGIPQRYDVCV